MWECADAANGYVVDLSVYTGKERGMNTKQGLGYRVVYKLTRPLVGENHHVVIDNFFSSIHLAENLLRENLPLQNCSLEPPGHLKGDRANNTTSETPSTRRKFISSERKSGRHCVEG